MDFGIDNEDQDSLWNDKVDSVCTGLSKIFPERSAAEFKRHLEEGHNKKARHWPIWPKRITYNTYTEVKALPFFSLSKNASGFHEEEFNARRRPFGSLGERTIGSMYGAKAISTLLSTLSVAQATYSAKQKTLPWLTCANLDRYSKPHLSWWRSTTEWLIPHNT